MGNDQVNRQALPKYYHYPNSAIRLEIPKERVLDLGCAAGGISFSLVPLPLTTTATL